mmetsp:Transcript_32193/g.91339  ORF Transcript_32193/g.91339 Transcript_32193/m.91339 type:complete len:167 (-) Transcript_32193:604-1104(-)
MGRESANHTCQGGGAPRRHSEGLSALAAQLHRDLHSSCSDEAPAVRHELLRHLGVVAVEVTPLSCGGVWVQLRDQRLRVHTAHKLAFGLQPQGLLGCKAPRVGRPARERLLIVKRLGGQGLQPGHNPRHHVQRGAALHRRRRPLPEGKGGANAGQLGAAVRHGGPN